jgi:hypothetical protein
MRHLSKWVGHASARCTRDELKVKDAATWELKSRRDLFRQEDDVSCGAFVIM